MSNPVLTYSETEFPVYEQLSSGEYVYYFDRQETEQMFEDNLKTVYTAIAVEFQTKPSYKEAVEKVIRKFMTSSEEFDLINSAYLGDDEEYKAWLSKLQTIKNKIAQDLK